MNILFVGDIVGVPGRAAIRTYLPQIKQQYQIDLVVANGENAAHGKGMTAKTYKQLLSYGIDVFTMGNHTFSNKQIYNFIDEAHRMVVPCNMDVEDVGNHVVILEVKGKKVAILNVLGEVFMINSIQSPFEAIAKQLEQLEADIYLCDFHGEATSEKIAFTYHFCNKFAAIVGTHTHVQTADDRIVYGCGAISDLGMCGAYTSVLGRDVDEILTRFTTNQKTQYKIAEGEPIFSGMVVTLDDTNNRCIHVERIQIRPENIENQ